MIDRSQAELISSYWDSLAAWYTDAYNDRWSQSEDRQVGEILARVLPERGLLADLGCGQGLGTVLTARTMSGLRYVGFDLSIAMLTRLRRSDMIHPVRADIRRIPLKTGSTAAVISLFGGASYVNELDEILTEVHRILAPDAVFVVMLFGRFSGSRLLRLKVGRTGKYGSYGAPVPSDIPASFYSARVSKRFETAGLQVDEIIGQTALRSSRFCVGLVWRLSCSLGRLAPSLGHSIIVIGHRSAEPEISERGP